jgi:hypothetical protein
MAEIERLLDGRRAIVTGILRTPPTERRCAVGTTPMRTHNGSM